MKIRASTVDGIFYPAEPPALASALDDLLGRSEAPPGEACCIISPHAAYDYSGSLSAAAFKAASARTVDTAVLIGPVHREPADRLILPESVAFQTPLGVCEVDGELLRALAGSSPSFACDDIPHLEEHCLEVQLPFLQHLHPRARIAPVLMGRPTPGLIQALVEAMARVLVPRLERTLIVISANMTSYKPKEQGEEELRELLGLIASGDWQAVADGAARGSISSCGAGCIAAILCLRQHLGARTDILKLGSSLAVNGDHRKVVHYAAIAFKRVNHGTEPDSRGTKTAVADRQGGD